MALRDGGGAAVLKRKMRGFADAARTSHCGTLTSESKPKLSPGLPSHTFAPTFLQPYMAMTCAYSTCAEWFFLYEKRGI